LALLDGRALGAEVGSLSLGPAEVASLYLTIGPSEVDSLSIAVGPAEVASFLQFVLPK
jgi:hypothetical protein